MRRAISIVLTEEERSRLAALTRSRAAAARLVMRARIVPAAGAGRETQALAAALRVAEGTVRTWRGRFARQRVPGIEREKPGPDRKPTQSKHVARTMVDVALHAAARRRYCRN